MTTVIPDPARRNDEWHTSAAWRMVSVRAPEGRSAGSSPAAASAEFLPQKRKERAPHGPLFSSPWCVPQYRPVEVKFSLHQRGVLEISFIGIPSQSKAS